MSVDELRTARIVTWHATGKSQAGYEPVCPPVIRGGPLLGWDSPASGRMRPEGVEPTLSLTTLSARPVRGKTPTASAAPPISGAGP